MQIELGIKSDPIEYRYTFEWLFSLMNNNGVRFLQLGSFFELYSLPDDYFYDLRQLAEKYDVRIKSLFTAHRELGGLFTGNAHMEAVARKNYNRFLEVGALLGVDYVGSNPGAVYRDKIAYKEEGIIRYIEHMKGMMHKAYDLQLKALSVEPMSSLAEPPTTPAEMKMLMDELGYYHARHAEETVPVYLCGDTSHGLADAQKVVQFGNIELFTYAIPWMCEFHFKNTDALFNSTFGFSTEERKRGIVDVQEIVTIANQHDLAWPVNDVVGYLEVSGPKLGRDYTDHFLGEQLETSLTHIKSVLQKG